MRAWQITGIVVLCGYLFVPSGTVGTVFEWASVAIALVTESYSVSAARHCAMADVVAIAAVGALLAAFGFVIRLLANDLSVFDAVLLIRKSEPLFGILQPVGYWILLLWAHPHLFLPARGSRRRPCSR